jgi:flagellar basal body-associated protein FliL
METVVFLPLHALEAQEAQGMGQKLEHVQGLLLVVLLVAFLVVLLVVVVVLVSSLFAETLYLMGGYPRFLLALGLCSCDTKGF